MDRDRPRPNRDRDFPRPERDAPRSDRDLRELLLYLRDTFRDAASRIDTFLEGHGASMPPPARERERAVPDRERPRPGPDVRPEVRPDPRGDFRPRDAGVHLPLEQLREEVRWISAEAGNMDPDLLRLYIEAVTAETRSLQSRASDPADDDIAAKIMRALTAIVSDHRPGHVYGLARHHQADWEDVGRRARAEIRSHSDGNAGGNPGGSVGGNPGGNPGGRAGGGQPPTGG